MAYNLCDSRRRTCGTELGVLTLKVRNWAAKFLDRKSEME